MRPQRPSIIRSYAHRRNRRSRVMPILTPNTPVSSPSTIVTIEGDGEISMHIIRAIAEHAAHAQQFLQAVTLSMATAAEEVRHETVSQETLDAVAPTKRYCKALQLNENQCSICLTEFRRNKHVKQLPCNHAFCSSCLSKWACELRACCPVCRSDISMSDSASTS